MINLREECLVFQQPARKPTSKSKHGVTMIISHTPSYRCASCSYFNESVMSKERKRMLAIPWTGSRRVRFAPAPYGENRGRAFCHRHVERQIISYSAID